MARPGATRLSGRVSSATAPAGRRAAVPDAFGGVSTEGPSVSIEQESFKARNPANSASGARAQIAGGGAPGRAQLAGH